MLTASSAAMVALSSMAPSVQVKSEYDVIPGHPSFRDQLSAINSRLKSFSQPTSAHSAPLAVEEGEDKSLQAIHMMQVRRVLVVFLMVHFVAYELCLLSADGFDCTSTRGTASLCHTTVTARITARHRGTQPRYPGNRGTGTSYHGYQRAGCVVCWPHWRPVWRRSERRDGTAQDCTQGALYLKRVWVVIVSCAVSVSCSLCFLAGSCRPVTPRARGAGACP